MINRNRGIGSIRAICAVLLVWTIASVGCSKEAAPVPAKPVTGAPAKSPSTVLASTKYGEITIQDLSDFALLNFYSSSNGIPLCAPLAGIDASSITEKSLPMDRAKLRTVVEWIASRRAADADVSAKNDPALNAFFAGGLQQSQTQMLFAYMLRKEIMEKVAKPSEEEIKQQYTKDQPLYYQPFSYTIRMLLMQTYEPYTVKAGDTIESIAQEVSGDAKAADNIRADVPGHPLRRDADKMFKPLYPGEKLLVPMGKSRSDQVRQRLENVLKELAKTTDTASLDAKFVELAKKYDESGLAGQVTTPMPTGTKQTMPPLTEITKAVIDTPVGQVSKPFKTKHGWQVVQVKDMVETHTAPLSDPFIRSDVVRKMMETRTMKAAEDVMNMLLDNPSLKVNYELIGDGARLTTDTVVATLGTDKLRWNELKKAWVDAGYPKDPVRIRKMLYQNPTLAAMMFRDHLKPLLDDPTNDLGRVNQAMKVAYIGSGYMSKMAAEETIKVLKNDNSKLAREFYEKNKETLYKTPESILFDVAMWPLPTATRILKPDDPARQLALEAALKQYQEELQKVKTPQDFDSLNSRMNEKMATAGLNPVRMPKPVPLEELPPDWKVRLEKLQPGQWTEPFIPADKSCVLSLRVTQRVPPSYEPMEKVIDKVNKNVFEREIAPILVRYEKEYLQRAELKPAPTMESVKLNPPAKTPEAAAEK